MAQLNFDARQVAPATGQMDAIPAGWYNVMIDQSEMKPTSKNDGFYLELRFNIIDGQYVGRKLFSRLNIRNANPTAQEIAYKDLSAIAHAVNVLLVEDSQQLHGIPLKVKVKLRAAQQEKDQYGNVLKDYEASNDISAYRNINENVSGGPASASSAPIAQSQPAAPTWTQPQAQQPWTQPAAPQQAPQAAPAAPAWAPPAQQAPQPPIQAPQQAPAWAPAQQQAPVMQPQQQAPTQAAPAMPAWANAAPSQPQPQQAPQQPPIAPPQAAWAPQQQQPAGAPVTPPWVK